MRDLQAILGDASDGRLGINIKSHRDLLKLVGKDAPGQVALLIALEFFLGVTNPGQLNQVVSLSQEMVEKFFFRTFPAALSCCMLNPKALVNNAMVTW